MRFRDQRPTIVKHCPMPERVKDSDVVLATPRRLSPFDPGTVRPRKGFAALVFAPTHNRASRRASWKPLRPMNLRRRMAAVRRAEAQAQRAEAEAEQS